MNKEIRKGSIDILILSLISIKDTYGYEIAKKVNEKSDGLYEMGEGTLYSALKRLEGNQHLESYWGESDGGGRRKYYRITDSGRKELNNKLDEWKKISRLIQVCGEEV
ncbi:PadR family transcriptional regulator [Natranaerovirga hydrolytica]|uniref:PadR family transcriptional regulator n=1 Tax=Natranaerovirga hydrolytica TaxID=680378 RepID=A0A4R1N3T9_9FIRM|nr:PadR family transcriptional regulator [Natranaerovirga hydrolytica]TCK98734.1 PadR family transcriptional regulator [Natranaerovirga hydrolytica]